MQLSPENLSELADDACAAARLAGELICSYTVGEVAVKHKEAGDSLATQVVTEVDEGAQAVILERLSASIVDYDLALLTEELEDDGSRFKKDYFWCIDPLDGTLPFTQGKPGYAVSIALVRRDGQPVIGVVFDPVENRLYRAVAGQGLTIDGQPWQAPALDPNATLRFCMDCTFETDPRREELTERMQILAIKMGFARARVEVHGGAVGNACYALEHPPAIYCKEPKPQLGGGSFWDFAATACIFSEAGGWVSDAAGEALRLNSATHSFFNHCGVCYSADAELAERLIAGLR